ncbi:hypothetical protein [Oscillibacter sp.]
MDDIAKEVGYQSKGNFYKEFAETFCCTPNEMRKNEAGSVNLNS